MKRHCGILMPVFALPGDYGTGTFGRESYDFIDFLADWEIELAKEYIKYVHPDCLFHNGQAPSGQ